MNKYFEQVITDAVTWLKANDKYNAKHHVTGTVVCSVCGWSGTLRKTKNGYICQNCYIKQKEKHNESSD